VAPVCVRCAGCSIFSVPDERNVLTPDVLVIRLIGFDRAYYCLGYGGDYHDRTPAAATRRPLGSGSPRRTRSCTPSIRSLMIFRWN
jgi:5-formyltetrahydrofolate cyclo-ligase